MNSELQREEEKGEPLLLLYSIRDVKKITPLLCALHPLLLIWQQAAAAAPPTGSAVRQFLHLLPLGHSKTCFFKSLCRHTHKRGHYYRNDISSLPMFYFFF